MANTFKLPPGIVCHPPNPPTKAQSDYIQNGLQLPKKKENLKRVLNQVKSQGYFNNEYNYALRRKESFKDFVKRLKDKIRDSDDDEEVHPPKTIQYEPMMEGIKFPAAPNTAQRYV